MSSYALGQISLKYWVGMCIFVANMIYDSHDEEEKFRIIQKFSSSACTFCVCAYIIV